ncbi:MAG: hypothetical protein Q9188_005137 [Gyalolechia gomerana]
MSDDRKDPSVGLQNYLDQIAFGSFTIKFGDFSTDGISPGDFKEVNSFVLYYDYLFLARFLIIYILTVPVMTASIRTTKALRRAFLPSTLRKRICGSIATQVGTNGNKITQGTANKLFLFVQVISTSLSAFVVALALQWKLALITLTCVPLIFSAPAVAIGLDSFIESKVLQIFSREPPSLMKASPPHRPARLFEHRTE